MQKNLIIIFKTINSIDDVYCETDEDCVDAGDWQMGYYCCYGNNKCCPNAVFCDCPAEANVVLKYSEKLSKHWILDPQKQPNVYF